MIVAELLVIVSIAGRRVALRSHEVESVVHLEVLTPAPLAPPHIAGLSGLRSRVLTVIDCQQALELGNCRNQGTGAPAAVVVHDGHAYALLLDAIEDVAEAWTEPSPIQGHLEGKWASMSHGMIETGLGPLLLANIPALIAGPQVSAAA